MTTDGFVTIQQDFHRNSYGHPLIVPPGGDDPVPYARASTVKEALDNGKGLSIYEQRYVAMGVGQRPDLAAIAAGATYGDTALDDVIAAAKEVAGANIKANNGTAIHQFTDQPGHPHIPEAMLPDVQAFHQLLADEHCTILNTELQVVCDELKTAGKLDNIIHHPIYGNIVIDKKTGRIHPHSFAIQLAIYAHGRPYNVETFKRGKPLDVSHSVAAVAHIPFGKGTAEFVFLDIETGWEAAKHARYAYDYTKNKNLILADPILDAIHTAENEAELRKLHAKHMTEWKVAHTVAAKNRIAKWKGVTRSVLT